ncbi:uncharacterized protein LOC128736682 [Sabethes cyaneus]|uniref:uncharacterized protein LOC128736682 n=1 Tax=Sabethes cyaneus TaxID=53552 RepID=UPI00237D8466|nr:uncharacterized protein LOC128736682 [Sabethes cyaneus]
MSLPHPDLSVEQLKADLATKVSEIEQLRRELAGISGRNSASEQRLTVESRRPDFRELKELVSRFNPKDPTCLSATEWIEEIETTARHYGWDAVTKLHCARLNLEGSAKMWWAGVQEVTTTWQRFSEKLVRAFPSARDEIYYHNQMTKRRKMREETIDEYVYSQAAMGKRAGFSERVVVKYIIGGLGEFGSKSRVQLTVKIDTIEELMSQLKWMEGMIDAPADTGAPRAVEKKKEVVCYKCRQPGHKAVACAVTVDRTPATNERMCYNCGIYGHMAKSCPSPKTTKPPPSKMQMVDEDNNFVKSVEVGEMTLSALVDSGCKVSTIQSRYAPRAGRSENANTTLVGFGGKKVNVEKYVTSLVKIDDIEVPVKLHVVPNWTQSTALILGRDVLNQEGVVMLNRNGKVEFRREDSREFCATKNAARQMVVELPPRKYESMFTIDCRTKVEKICEDDVNAEGSKSEVVKLINQYRSCFAKNMRELGVAKNTEMKIVLTDQDPVYVKPHRMEYARETALRAIVEELIEAGIVKESNSPYSSRVVLVPKKDGSFRMAVDYRMLNTKTVKDRYPMPDIEWCLNKLSGAELFITVDLYSGYYQIPMAEES